MKDLAFYLKKKPPVAGNKAGFFKSVQSCTHTFLMLIVLNWSGLQSSNDKFIDSRALKLLGCYHYKFITLIHTLFIGFPLGSIFPLSRFAGVERTSQPLRLVNFRSGLYFFYMNFTDTLFYGYFWNAGSCWQYDMNEIMYIVKGVTLQMYYRTDVLYLHIRSPYIE